MIVVCFEWNIEVQFFLHNQFPSQEWKLKYEDVLTVICMKLDHFIKVHSELPSTQCIILTIISATLK